LADVVSRDYNSTMVTVGIRELKAHLSAYVRRARAGEVVLVSDRGEVVAQLAPVGPDGRTDVPAGLRRLAQEGKLRLGQPNDPSLYPIMAPVLPPGSAQRLLDEERGER
jgi:prevent-host-death family protein